MVAQACSSSYPGGLRQEDHRSSELQCAVTVPVNSHYTPARATQQNTVPKKFKKINLNVFPNSILKTKSQEYKDVYVYIHTHHNAHHTCSYQQKYETNNMLLDRRLPNID